MEAFTNPYKAYSIKRNFNKLDSPIKSSNNPAQINLNNLIPYYNDDEVRAVSNKHLTVKNATHHTHTYSGNIEDQTNNKYFSSHNLNSVNTVQIHPINKNSNSNNRNPYEKQSLKMNILENQIKNLASKREEERHNLLNIINQNMFSPQNKFNTKSTINLSKVIEPIKEEISPREIGYFNPSQPHPYEEPVMGINPKVSNTSSTSSLVNNKKKKTSKFAVSTPVKKQNFDDSEPSSEGEQEDEFSSQRKTKTRKIIHEDVIAQHAFEEMNDNLDSLRTDFTNQIRKLQRAHDKVNPSHIMEELVEFREMFSDSMKKSNDRSKNEIVQLRGNFNEMKADIDKKLLEETNENKEILKSMINEVKEYQHEMQKRMAELGNHQKKQIEGLKLILENTSDPRTKALSQKFLTEDEEAFEKNKNGYIEPNKNELSQIILDVQKKKQEKNKNGRYDSEKNDETIRKFLNKTKEKNKLLEDVANSRDDYLQNKKGGKEKRELLQSVTKRLGDHIAEEGNFKMEGINHFRKYVYLVIACRRLEQVKKASYDDTFINSLRKFSKMYTECDELLKDFVSESVKISFHSILNFENVKLDLTDFKLTKSSEDAEIKDKYIKLEVRLKGFLDNLIENTTKEKMNPKLREFLKFLITNNSYIPFKFLSLYEVSRLELSKSPYPKDCLLGTVKEKHAAMILCCYVLIKILVRHFLFEQNHIPMSKKRSMNVNVIKNFKIVSSIIFCDIIELYRKHCPIVTTINNYESFIKGQTCFEDNSVKSEFNISKIDKKTTDPSYLEALKKYYNNKAKKNTSTSEFSSEERDLLTKINSKLPQSSPDTDINNIEYLQNYLYKTSDLATYYTLAKENKFDLTQKIFLWVKKLIKLLKE